MLFAGASGVNARAIARRGVHPERVESLVLSINTRETESMDMRRLFAGLVVTMMAIPFAPSARAQTKTLQGDMQTITATVEAVQASTRTLTLKGPNGNYVDMVVPETVDEILQHQSRRQDLARYYDNIVLQVQQPGAKPIDSDSTKLTKTDSSKPGATVANQRTITATITAIDMSVPSISFAGPNDWKYSSRVEDKKMLAKVKVGDKVDITWTEALMVSFDTPAK